MKKYTLEDWLEGEIEAKSDNFNNIEWEKVQTAQKKVYFERVERAFENCLEEFDTSLENSEDQELFLESAFISMDNLISANNTHLTKKDKKDFETSLHYIPFAEDYDIVTLRNAIRSVISGRQFFHLIRRPLKEVSDRRLESTVRVQIYASALIKFHNHLREKLPQIDQPNYSDGFEKIIWLGSPSQFGYLFQELVKKGFIEPPKSRGVYSNKKLARLCFSAFKMNATLGTLEKEFSKKNSLTSANRDSFSIPNKDDLS